jgi:hypothetical protein
LESERDIPHWKRLTQTESERMKNDISSEWNRNQEVVILIFYRVDFKISQKTLIRGTIHHKVIIIINLKCI